MTADAIVVTLVSEYVRLLRAAGFRGQILTPGLIKPASDSKPAAFHNTVVVLD